MQVFEGLAVAALGIGEALKLPAVFPLLLALAIFAVCGFIYWFSWVKD
ncbi:MAG: hypothetical protein GY951_00415 [Psychromonas sp.]|nr:hypothetical protein [Psychromonas sp.]